MKLPITLIVIVTIGTHSFGEIKITPYSVLMMTSEGIPVISDIPINSNNIIPETGEIWGKIRANALEKACDIAGSWFDIQGNFSNIKVGIYITDLDENESMRGGPMEHYSGNLFYPEQNCPGLPNNSYVCYAEACHLLGRDLSNENNNYPEIHILIKVNKNMWTNNKFIFEGRKRINGEDYFIDCILHELIHGLGMSGYYCTGYMGCECGNFVLNKYSIYDTKIFGYPLMYDGDLRPPKNYYDQSPGLGCGCFVSGWCGFAGRAVSWLVPNRFPSDVSSGKYQGSYCSYFYSRDLVGGPIGSSVCPGSVVGLYVNDNNYKSNAYHLYESTYYAGKRQLMEPYKNSDGDCTVALAILKDCGWKLSKYVDQHISSYDIALKPVKVTANKLNYPINISNYKLNIYYTGPDVPIIEDGDEPYLYIDELIKDSIIISNSSSSSIRIVENYNFADSANVTVYPFSVPEISISNNPLILGISMSYLEVAGRNKSSVVFSCGIKNDIDDDGLCDDSERIVWKAGYANHFNVGAINNWKNDSDNDNICDGIEMALGYNPLDSNILPHFEANDIDGDGLGDIDESSTEYISLNPFNLHLADVTGTWPSCNGRNGIPDGLDDYDGDGMKNSDEFDYGYNPFDRLSNAILTPLDADGDGMKNENELRADLIYENPFNPTNGDSTGNMASNIPDGWIDGLNDYDGDGQSNSCEFEYGSDPTDPTSTCIPIDSDGDGICDVDESLMRLDPYCNDSDDDGIFDGDELYIWYTDPIYWDSDGDRLSDGFEIQYGFNPMCWDCMGSNQSIASDGYADGYNDWDGDGASNQQEQQWGFNPRDGSGSIPFLPVIRGNMLWISAAAMLLLGIILVGKLRGQKC